MRDLIFMVIRHYIFNKPYNINSHWLNKAKPAKMAENEIKGDMMEDEQQTAPLPGTVTVTLINPEGAARGGRLTVHRRTLSPCACVAYTLPCACAAYTLPCVCGRSLFSCATLFVLIQSGKCCALDLTVKTLV